ncbi:YbfB/YjiJ family MFS transporter [Stutzerimonas tarimensis]|uniref:YbfB/YjiJ family MFS transporter n=1 Tax=Stutzerimonas tarimensis TaxID=1507735 RepID=A0ABV7T654_9GAMM
MRPAPLRDILVPLLAGAAALVVVHSLGRFAFPPLLPHLLADGLLNLEQGARVATWNYIGYLLGALLALALTVPSRLQRGLALALLVNAFSTLAHGFTDNHLALLWLRLINGVGNGVVFVLAPALLLEWLSARGRAGLSGLVYFGFAAGMLVANWLANAPANWLSGPSRWLPMAALALPLALASAWLLARLEATPPKVNQANAPSSRLFDRASTPLFLAYAGAGLGYILPMTFLPTLAIEHLPAGHALIAGTWRWTAIACMGGILLWNYLGARLGDLPVLRATYAAQALGAAAPLIWPGAVGVTLCAVLIGGSFVGTVLLTQRVARAFQPHQGPRLSAALIALYSVGQLAGPWLAELWLARGGTLTQSFAFGAAALVWGLLWASLTPSLRNTR